MREYTEPPVLPTQTPFHNVNEVSPFKEGLELLKANFWALIGPYLALGILGACALQGLWDLIFGTALMMGANISLLEYKAQGTPFSFGRTISVGFSNWWKGFKINFVTGLFATLVVVIVLAVILPGAFLIEEGNAPIFGGVLLTVGFLGSLYACYWFLSRCFLGQACMADNGISASHCFNKAYNMAKSNQALLRPIAFTFMGIWLAIVVIGLLLIVINIELAQDYREGASIGVVMVSPLYCIVVSYQRLVLNLAYQRIRNQNAVTKVIGS
jgi:hypothetical protein